METVNKTRKLRSPDGTVVLTVSTILPSDAPKYINEFYKSILDAFESEADKSLYDYALRAFTECTDRRKRYRYIPKQALFNCSVISTDTYRLTASFDGVILISESHKWSEDVVIKRHKAKNIP